LIAYQTAWLKANYPAHFLAASLSVDMDNTDKVVMLIAEARDMNIKVLPPDINQCEYRFIAADENSILYGLGAIKGLGRPVIESVIEQRRESGDYTDLFQLCNRVSTHKVNRRALEALVCAGALDGFAVGRASLSASISCAIDAANQRLSDKEAGQSDLFGISEEKQNHVFYINVPDWNEDHRLKQEKATLGLYLSGHPVEQYRNELNQFVSSRLVDLRPRDSNQVIAGLVLGIRTMFNRRGEKFAFVTLDDNTARIEVNVFAELYGESFEKLRHDRIIVIKGVAGVDERNNGIQMRAEAIYRLPEYRVISANALIITTSDVKLASDGEKFKHLISHAGKGGLPIVLRYQKHDCMAQIRLGEQFSVIPENPLLFSLQELFGKNAVEINYSSQGDMRH
jgi:DNA polymerase-3 subunit alpha